MSKKTTVYESEKEEIKHAIISVFTNSGVQYQKSNGLINAKGKPTLTALRLFAISTKYARYDESINAAVSIIPINDIKKLLRLKGHSFSTVVNDSTSKTNRNSLLDWRIITEKASYNVIQDAICFDGLLYVTFNSKLSVEIINLKNNYTTLNLDETLILSSTHALHLYEILKSRLDFLRAVNKTDGEVSWKIHITDLKLRLGLVDINRKIEDELKKDDPDWEYIENIIKKEKIAIYNNEYKTIKSKVINKALKEINEKTHLIVSFTEKKVSRAVKEIVFSINDRREDETIINSNVSVINAKDNIDSDEINQEMLFMQIYTYLIKYHLSPAEIKEIAKTANYDMNKIKKAYDVALAQNEITNFVGFMIKAIENNYEPPKKHSNKKADSFHNFEERTYNYDELEKRFVKNM